MNVVLYSITLIAISVIFSTVINVIIMRKVAEMAAEELGKAEKRLMSISKVILRENN